ncbi:efflux RND transporter periplasmic adaptor subunit [Sulfurospirillum sp. 1307]
MKKRVLINTILSATMLISGSIVYAAGAPSNNKMPTPHVDVFEVKAPSKLKIDNLIYPAQTNAKSYVSIVAKVSGTLEEMKFKEGDVVKKGDTLFKINDNIYKASLDEAKANLDLNEANLYRAQKDWQRAKKLFKQHSISEKEKDNAFSAYKSAQAGVQAAKATIQKAQINFDYTNVTSPINGITTIKKIDVGNFVNPGTPLVDIYNIDRIYANFSMPKSDFEKLQSIYKVDGNLKIDILKNNKVIANGNIDYLDKKIDRSTSTVKLRAIIDNKDKKLLPGDFIRVKLSNVYQSGAILIPQKSILQSAKGTIVFIEENGKVGVRPIFSMSEYKDKYIVKGLIKPGDKVIVNNFFRIKPGANIVVDKTINKE